MNKTKKQTWKNLCGKSARRCLRSWFFHIWEHFFQSFCTKFLSLLYMISLAYKNSHCLSANRNPELWCVIYTGVSLLHLCYTWTALLSAIQNQVISSCVLLASEIWLLGPNRQTLNSHCGKYGLFLFTIRLLNFRNYRTLKGKMISLMQREQTKMYSWNLQTWLAMSHLSMFSQCS